jgi:Alw26I/Eco31I/Esp3I family type II restriction m6 adenine DNA methyltransferase
MSCPLDIVEGPFEGCRKCALHETREFDAKMGVDMQHVNVARAQLASGASADVWLQNMTGRYYTHEVVGRHLADALWRAFTLSGDHTPEQVAVCDPFGGDGRLVAWLIEQARHRTPASWRVELWDLHEDGLREAEMRLEALAHKLGTSIECKTRVLDSFAYAAGLAPEFDVVITNPPWENLKPDRRELAPLSKDEVARYVAALRETDIFLSRAYPTSQPTRKFAGWGTNLARVGIELSLRIAREGGAVGVVSPASFFADDSSRALRRWLLAENELVDLAYFPAEARLFGRADVSTATFAARRSRPASLEPSLTMYGADLNVKSRGSVSLSREFLDSSGYLVPISLGHQAANTLGLFADLPTLGSIESREATGLWAGRELDETRVGRFLRPAATGSFIKGRMIGRYEVRDRPSFQVNKPGWEPPASVGFERVAWRDVSRPNQKRRVQATLIPPRWIAGNSLGVAHFRDADPNRLRLLLGLMNSFPFEFQLRSVLATGHVTLTALRCVRLPVLHSHAESSVLLEEVRQMLEGKGNEHRIEAAAAKMFGLTPEDMELLMGFFPKVTQEERTDVLSALRAIPEAS